MSKKTKHTGPVPKGNQSPYGPGAVPSGSRADASHDPDGSPLSNQDPQRRLGSYEGAGDSSIVQPGGKQASKRD